ncbi:MAG TPA: hypothetical protein VMP01_29335 [Pirellulaceae bacterium]|nr:hypothetical protein [Pirellulaceae bacterium]
MNFQNASFVRKIGYLAAIAVLLLPIAYLSQPATISRAGGGSNVSAGGKLAKLRTEYNLSQAELGEIDPASETMKLATVGLRGVAVNILWTSAIHYQKVKDFNNLELTVKQIIRLQPNFLKVWDFQAHNLSYNTSVEFDNYRDRYQWVKKGIAFLILGTQYNRDEPGLLNSVGWFVGQKMGRSDENRQFRRLFKEDRDLHAEFFKHGVDVDRATVLGKPDSWLVSRLWYLKGEDAVARGKPLRLKSPLLYYNSAPMALINHATALEQDDAIFGQTAQFAWERADASWKDYGRRDLLASAGFMIRLNSVEEFRQKLLDLQTEMDRLVPGVREKLKQERIAALDPRLRVIAEKDYQQQSPMERMINMHEVIPRIRVSEEEVVAQASKEKRTAARDLADRIASMGEVMQTTSSYGGIVNYEYWKARCEAEQLEIALNARELVVKADRIRRASGQLSDARKMYEEAWENWAQLFEKYPVLLDSVQGQELVQSVIHYRELLDQLGEDFPADFRLNTLLEQVHEGRMLLEELRVVQGTPSSTTPPQNEPPKSPDAPESNNAPVPKDDSKSDKNEKDKPGTDKAKVESTPRANPPQSDTND